MERIMFILPLTGGILVLIFRKKWIDAATASHYAFFGERGISLHEKFARFFVPFIALGFVVVGVLGFLGIE